MDKYNVHTVKESQKREHPPEPWYAKGRLIYDKNHNLIASTHTIQDVSRTGDDIGRAVADRIVKLINIFRNIETPDLNSIARITKELGDKIAHYRTEYDSLYRENKRLVALHQRIQEKNEKLEIANALLQKTIDKAAVANKKLEHAHNANQKSSKYKNKQRLANNGVKSTSVHA